KLPSSITATNIRSHCSLSIRYPDNFHEFTASLWRDDAKGNGIEEIYVAGQNQKERLVAALVSFKSGSVRNGSPLAAVWVLTNCLR
ncbi:hypothetical protein LZS97_02450, partial [Vibrio fluvialis]|uniref:hypothetical protein n=1 Tax=Vibrio fluvialis TaxID=676 RepID=UPI001F2F79FA